MNDISHSDFRLVEFDAPMVELDAFLPYIESEVPSCPLPVIELYMRRALVNSCENVPLWRWQHPELASVKAQKVFRLQTPTSESDIHSILGATLDDRDIHTCPMYHVPDRGVIQLDYCANVDSDPFDQEDRRRTGLVALLSIKPSNDATQVPELLFREYQEMIVAATLTRLFALMNRDWTDPNASYAYAKVARGKEVEARQAIDRGFRHGSLRVTAPPFIHTPSYMRR